MKSSLRFLLTAFFVATSLLFAHAAPGQEELEQKFKQTLTNATFSGRWFPLQDGQLGEQKEDKYQIESAEKQSGNDWILKVKMRGTVLPLPVKVQWAGEAAVIIVDALRLPGYPTGAGPSYTARVLIHEQTYAGSWSGGDHAGLLTGVIKHE